MSQSASSDNAFPVANPDDIQGSDQPTLDGGDVAEIDDYWAIPEDDPEIPYFDPEFNVGASEAHSQVISLIGPIFGHIAEKMGWRFLTDNPVYYRDKLAEKSHIRFGDLMLVNTSKKRVYADDAVFLGEVVTTTHRQKMHKDTIRMRNLGAANRIPEFGLFWPEPEDDRVLNLFQWVDGEYQEILPNEEGEIHSHAIPHLIFKPLPREQWRKGIKFEVNYHGRIGSLHTELEKRREEEALRREEEALRREEQVKREEAEARARAAEEENARLLALLKQAGLQP